jgi:subtilisin family serine protease
MRRFALLAVLALPLLSAPSTAHAQSAPPFTRTSPLVRTLFAHRARTGHTFPAYRADAAFEADGALPLVVRFATPPQERERARLETRGVRFAQPTPLASGAWLARATESGVAALESDRNVTRIVPDLQLVAPRPLDASAVETRTTLARRALYAKDGTLLDGAGTTVADIDSPIFAFHPGLFRADGGARAWFDVDKDGKLTPGKDGIDLDGSGTLEPGELLYALTAREFSLYGDKERPRADAFLPDVDYLYLDTNGNGRRDYGKAFSEETPAYGEPIFVVDDANHDGVIAPSERLLQLKTSKLKAVRYGGKDYVRGGQGTTGLSRLDPGSTPQIVESMGHATGVTGILAGGVPGLSRYVGLAPGVELLVSADQAASTLQQLDWAIFKKANVLLTEYAPYVMVSLDGSSEEDALIDAALAKGIVTVSPAGNLVTGKKHRTISFPAGSTVVPIQTDAAFDGSQFLAISTHRRVLGRNLSFSLKLPGGKIIPVPDDLPGGQDVGDGQFVYSQRLTTPRQTDEQHFQIYVPKGTLPIGAYELTVTADPGPDLETELFIADYQTSWAYGATFTSDSPDRTLCAPSTADGTISVAAYVLHDDPFFYPFGKAGELAGYSGRGPRIDGDPGIEIAAPDNPMSFGTPRDMGASSATLTPFGGTSGAGPHVAAAVALLRQLFPKDDGPALRARLLGGARNDAFATPDAKTTFGAGKLDVAKAAGLSVFDGKVPVVKLLATRSAETTVRLDPLVTDDEPSAALRARWDLDYDGTWDTGWEPLGARDVPVTTDAVVAAKVEVLDGQGNVSGDTALLVVATAPIGGPDGGAGASPNGGGSCGCSVPGRGVGGPFAALFATAGLVGVMVRRRRRR